MFFAHLSGVKWSPDLTFFLIYMDCMPTTYFLKVKASCLQQNWPKPFS